MRHLLLQVQGFYNLMSLLAGINCVYDEILQLMARTRDLWLIVKGISMIPLHPLLILFIIFPISQTICGARGKFSKFPEIY
ncbi:hypothetical protein H5410_028233 [Solanum commersonii]|uniref:Uncharacterized protein n=1 Tax=Solanum commersonii TaxID=4109 RepID=A0A9J5Z3G5_SOLCO|nr:hypothetical protein H5410_028233 [Solanum commersonii]